MDYNKHYDILINRAKNRILDGYVEEHHILPRCMGGGNNKENLVKLTPEEHFVAHQLLIKIYPNVPGLVYAVRVMCFGNGRNNKWYGWLKKRFSTTHSQYRHTEETKNKISKSRMGVSTHNIPHSEETKLKISKSVMAGRTPEMNRVHSIKMSGRKLTEEHKNKIKESEKKKKMLKEDK